MVIILNVVQYCIFVQALNALERYPTPKSRQALTSTIENENLFYLVRIDAAHCLAKVSLFTSAMFALTFQHHFVDILAAWLSGSMLVLAIKLALCYHYAEYYPITSYRSTPSQNMSTG